MSEKEQPEPAAKKTTAKKTTAKKSPAKKTARRAGAPAGPPPAAEAPAPVKKASAARPAKKAASSAGSAGSATAKASAPRRPARRAVSPVTSAGPATVDSVDVESAKVTKVKSATVESDKVASVESDTAAPVEAASASAGPVETGSVSAEPVEAASAPVEPAASAEPVEAEKPAQVQRVKATVEVTEPAVAPAQSQIKAPAPSQIKAPAPSLVTAPAGSRATTGNVAPASEAEVQRAWQDNALAQVLYHDWEAGTYDEKWSISFDDRCITYARDRFSSLVGPEVLRTEQWPYRRTLEIGAGTGFFALNLKQAGVLDEVHVSDVSAGMVESAQRNARGLGFEVQGTVAGAEQLPYEDGYFDLVIGHAVIHHIPDVESALREVLRVLRPGGRFVIAGEPTRIGDWYARRLGRATWKVTTAVTGLPRLREKWAKSQEELDASSRAAALEAVVDLHTFVPEELQAMAERAGALEVHTQTEELLAALLGWPVRTFEAAVNPEALGWGWAMFAYKSWQRLSAVDRVLSRALPASVFYNVGITGTKRYR
jgi:ubiquinone/menaquinone biosynthesis C-methylase UbiE